MTKTKEELIARALNKLGVIGSGQTADASDTLLVNDVVGPVMSDLATRDIYSWGDPDALDEDAFEHLAECLSIAVARDFGVEPNENMRLLAESRLRQLNLVFLSGQPQTTDYF